MYKSNFLLTKSLPLLFIFFLLKFLYGLPSNLIHYHLSLLPFPDFPTSNHVFSIIPFRGWYRELISDTKVNTSPNNSRTLSTLYLQRAREVQVPRNTWPPTVSIIHEKQPEDKIRKPVLIGHCYRAEHTQR